MPFMAVTSFAADSWLVLIRAGRLEGHVEEEEGRGQDRVISLLWGARAIPQHLCLRTTVLISVTRLLTPLVQRLLQSLKLLSCFTVNTPNAAFQLFDGCFRLQALLISLSFDGHDQPCAATCSAGPHHQHYVGGRPSREPWSGQLQRGQGGCHRLHQVRSPRIRGKKYPGTSHRRAGQEC